MPHQGKSFPGVGFLSVLFWLNHFRCLSNGVDISVSSTETMDICLYIHTLLKRL